MNCHPMAKLAHFAAKISWEKAQGMELSRFLGSNLGSLLITPSVISLWEMMAEKALGGQADHKMISNHLSEGAVRKSNLQW